MKFKEKPSYPEHTDYFELKPIEMQSFTNFDSWLFYPSNKKVVWLNQIFHIGGLDLKQNSLDYDTMIQSVHHDNPDLWINFIEKAAILQTLFDIQYRINLSNRTQKLIRSSYQPTLNQNCKVINLAISVQNITKQKPLN